MIYVWVAYWVGFWITLTWYGMGELSDRFRGRLDPEYRKKLDDEFGQYMKPSNQNIAALIFFTALIWPVMMVAEWTGWGED